MDSALTLVLLTTLSCVGLALMVRFRRERSAVVGTVLALLASLCVWNVGIALAHVGDDSADLTALRIALLGMFATCGLWLLLALRQRWPRQTGGIWTTWIALSPALLFFVGAISPTGHGWMLRTDALFDPRPALWAGPLGYALLVPARAADLLGSALFGLAALRMWRTGERTPALALGLALLAPPVTGLLLFGGNISPTFPVVPAAQTLATLVLALTLLRYQLVEPPPIGHREVIEHLRHGVLIANASGEILDYNEAAELVFARPPGGLPMIEALAALTPPERYDAVHAELAAAEYLDEPVSTRIECRDGRHLEVTLHAIRGAGAKPGDTLGQVALVRDRTEERRYADAALRTQKLETVGTLAAGIAHELNNPLAFVRANLGEVARLAGIVDARRRAGGSALAEDLAELGELAGDTLDGLKRIQQAVSDVRRLAAAPAGTDDVALDTVVLDAVRLVELRGGSRIAVETHLSPDLPTLRGSRQLLVQSLLNLLMNAQQATEDSPDPRIVVETGADAGGLWLRVRDNGPGVPDALRAAIFRPFFTTAREQGCRGLGLSVASDVAREHGGSLVAERVESGASFVLRVARGEEGD